MSFEADFRTWLLSDTAFSNAVGARLYVGRLLKQNGMPAGAVHLISDVPANDHDTLGDTLSERRIQVDLYGEDAETAAAARDALKAFVNGAAAVVGDTDIQEASWESCFASYEEELKLYRYSCDVMVMSKPAEE